MLSRDNFTDQHIRHLQDISKRDPILLERTVYAFGLLEALRKVDMPFIFKGGTSLMLLLEHTQRLSTDIDIVVPPGTDVDDFINRAAEIFPFKSKEEALRIGKNQIVKKHYKFIYDSPIKGSDFYILLDILFEENNYATLREIAIRNELLITEGADLTVQVPGAESMLGDKLTAFAPHTTGILLHDKNKRVMEIMKQMYDVSSLVDICHDFEEVRRTYRKVQKAETAYRGEDYTEQQCLEDTMDACICIASRGKYNPEDYTEYVKGIRDLRSHIFAEQYSPELALPRAAKIIYLTACLMKEADYEEVFDFRGFAGEKLTLEKFHTLRTLRKGNPLAYAYVVKADQLLSK